MKAVESMPSTCWFDGRPVSVCRPKFAAVAVPVTWIVSVDRAAADRLVDEGGGVHAEYLLVRRQAGQRMQAEVRRRRGAGDLDRIGQAVGADLDVAVGRIHRGGAAGQRREL